MAAAPPDDDFNQSFARDSDEEQSNDSGAEDKFCQLFAVYCTSQIPTARLDEFFESVREYCPPTTGVVLRLITSKSDLNSPPDGIRKRMGGTRPPVPDFQTPFKDYNISELRPAFLEGIERVTDPDEEWTESCFAVLDQRFLEDDTVLLVTAEPDDVDEQILDHRCDAKITLNLLLHYDFNRLGIDWHDADSMNWSMVITAKEYQAMACGRPYP